MFRMKGVVPPMVTPFREDGELDLPGLRTLVRYLKGEVDGLFVTGSYGGAALMTAQERMTVAKTCVETAGGEIPVVVHVGTADSLSAAALTRHAVEIGAAAVSAVGPFYYKHDDDGVVEFYARILEAADGKLPVYVYNNPQFQGYPMSLKLLKRLKALGVSGLKDATFDIILHATYLRELWDDDRFDVALGTEAMWLSAAVLGCQAYIPGLGNAFPQLCRKMYQEAMAGDYAAARKTQFLVNELRDVMYLARSTQLAVYAMLELRGIVTTYPRSPFVPATPQEKAAMRQRLQALGLL